jgi:hypothetical protein
MGSPRVKMYTRNDRCFLLFQALSIGVSNNTKGVIILLNEKLIRVKISELIISASSGKFLN